MNNRIMIVDDSETNRQILEELLQEEYELALIASGEECLDKMLSFAPDLVLLDIMMPGIDGYETCRRIKSGPLGQFTQVVLVSGKASAPERVQGYEVGADSYIVKPFDHEELLAKVRVHFRLRDTLSQLWLANARVQEFNGELERLVQERTAEVVVTRDVMAFSLAKLAESRDPETGEHLDRMRNYSRMLAQDLLEQGCYAAEINESFVKEVYRSSPLHDIGKVGTPDAVLLKPGRLTPEEFEIMKQHTVIGGDTLRQAAEQSPCGGFLEMARDVARHHHERFDGKGYPDGLSGEEIPLAARIVALADVFDALTSARVYKPAYDAEFARELIEREDGAHFDPVVVAAFRRLYADFCKLIPAVQSPAEAVASG